MGIMPNFRQLMQKADLSSSYLQSNGGYLAPIQDTTFIRMLTEEPTLLRLARTVTMNGPIREFSLVGFGGRILRPHPGSGNKLADSDRTRPDTLRTTLTSKPFLGQVNLPYDMLEDNIERGNFEDTIIALITPQVSLDMNEIAILGDTDSTDPFLAQMDGVLKLATAHPVDSTATPVTVIDDIPFKAGMQALPNKYRRNRQALMYLVSPNTEIEYGYNFAKRQTPGADQAIISNLTGTLTPLGTSLRSDVFMPDDKYLLTPMDNVLIGIQRQIRVRLWDDIEEEVIKCVVSLRMDVQLMQNDATVQFLGLAAA